MLHFLGNYEILINLKTKNKIIFFKFRKFMIEKITKLMFKLRRGFRNS